MSSDARRSGAPIRHLVTYVLLVVLGWKLRCLPRRGRLALGRLAGGMVFRLDKKHQAITVDNLDLAFGSTKSDEEKFAIARRAYRHFGAMLFELISLGKPSWRRLQRLVEFEGVENYEQARALGRGVLLVAAHFGNWEIHALAHGYRFGPMAVVGRLQGNPHLDRWLERIRTVSGNTVIYKQRVLVRMMRLLKQGGTVAVLIDQNVARSEAVFVDFFGRPAATTPVASWLAVKTGAVLVPVFTLPLADGRYRLIYERPIRGALDGEGAEPRRTAEILTQRCAAVLERYVRWHPELWLWMHRRWKTQPAGEAFPAAAVRAGEAS